MIPAAFGIRDRGSTPRGMARRMNGHKKEAWYAAGVLFHQEMRDQRFTHKHATAAGYTKRKRLYEKRKFKKFGHTRPLEFSGTARKAIRIARISSTSNGAKVAYAGARVFNFRNPKSSVNMVAEFTKITQAEADQLAQRFDQKLDRDLKSDGQEN